MQIIFKITRRIRHNIIHKAICKIVFKTKRRVCIARTTTREVLIVNASNVESLFKKNIFKICLLAFAGSIIYGLPYFRYYYYDAYLAAYGLNNTQMGTLGSAYGLLGLLSYLIGGVLADRVPAKTLLIFSLVATGLGGFLHILFPSYWMLVGIYGAWGITSLLTFWPALMKIIRMMAAESEQSRAYGLFEGGRGVVNAVHTAIATAIFGIFQAKAAGALGLKWIIVFYSIAPVLCGLLFCIVLKNIETKTEERPGFSIKNVVYILKMPAVWMVAAITFSTYIFNMSYFYFTPYATNALGISAVTAAIITVLAQYCRPLASPLGGFVADRFGKSQVMFLGFLVMAASTFAIINIPQTQNQIYFLIIACSIFYLAMYSNFGIYFSLLTEGGVPLEHAGVAIGFVSTLGYIPEILCPYIAGKTLDVYKDATGYHIYFTGMIVVAVVGMALTFAWSHFYAPKKNALAVASIEKQGNERG